MKELKDKIVADLHHILYGLNIYSDNENWDLRVAMAKCILTHHRVHFKDDGEVKGAEYWQHGMDAEKHFFTTAAPGVVPSITEFELMCDNYMDFDMWEQMQSIKPIEQALDLAGAIRKVLLPEPTGNYEVTIIVDKPNKAA